MASDYVVGVNKQFLKIKKGDIRKPGDEVPEASNWKPNILSAHLSLKWLTTPDEYELAKKLSDKRNEDLKKRKDADRARRKKIHDDVHEKNRKAAEENEKLINEKALKEKAAKEKASKEEEDLIEESSEEESDESEVESDESDDGEENLDALSRNQLREIAKKDGLSPRGKKAELLQRIKDHRED